jgi:hypothetical protein
MIEDERRPLETVILKAFPTLSILATKLLSSYNPSTASLVKSILKIYHMSIEIQMPEFLSE